MENKQTFKELSKSGREYLCGLEIFLQLRRKLYLLMVISLISANLSAEEFTVDNILYNVLSSTDNTVEVAAAQNPGTYGTSVSIPNTISYGGKTWNVVAIGDNAFSLYSPEELKSITIGNAVKRIGESAFSGCRNLETISGGASVEMIGDNAFSGCSSLNRTISGSSLTEIGNYAYRGCTSLTSASIGEDMTSIGIGVYKNCTGVERLYIGHSVQIPDEFCYGCTNLSTITYEETYTKVFSVGGYAFYNCGELVSLRTTSDCQFGDFAFANCTKFSGTISTSSSIGQGAFMNCKKITRAVNLRGDIGIDAFSGSGLTEVSAQTVNIGNGAFSNCEDLTSASLPNVKILSGSLFEGCSLLSTITLPSNYTSIGARAFSGCSSLALEAFEIPKEVSSIGGSAFSGCSGIKSVIFNGSLPQFGGLAYTVLSDCPLLTDIYFPAYDYSSYISATYLKTGYITNGSDVERTLHPQIKLPKEWNSYCSTGTFEVPDGIEAYIVKSAGGSTVSLKQVSVINSGQGVILKPALTNTAYDAITTTYQAYDTNLLVGTTISTDLSTPEDGYTNFILYNGEFRRTSGTISAFKAYLPLPIIISNARSLSIVLEDGTTNIKNISNDYSEDAWYDLNGVRFESIPAKKGLYIHNGKLSINK